MDTEKFSNEFMKTLLLNKTKRQRFANAQKFYWNCIRDNGYSDLQQDQSTNESSDELDEYSDFIPKETDTIDKFCERCNSELSSSQQCKICNIYSSFLSNKNIARTTAPGFQESQNATSVNVYGFNRTFIGPYDDSSTKSGNRLSEIQTWVTVEPKEMELKKVHDIFESSLNGLGIGDNDRVLKTAVNMYFNLLTYYESNELDLPSMRGDLKRGYIILCLYYALIANKINISRERLIRFIPDARLSYLPKADIYIHKIFENAPGYSFLISGSEPIVVTNLCGLISSLPKSIVRDIQKVKKDLYETFGKVFSGIQIAACIYYVCSKIQQKRLTITVPETGKQSKITVELLSRCGSFSPGTLAKNVKVIEDFYIRHPELFTF
jgi:hypothetical protein